MPKHYACSLDVNPKHRTVFVCGVPKDPAKDPNPAILCYSINETGNLIYRGAIERDNVKLVSCVKAMVYDSRNLFVTGETSKNPSEGEYLKVYDMGTASSFSKLQPSLVYKEHTNIITSLACYPNRENLFFSGSRDHTVKLWDLRQPKSACM